MAFDTDLGPEAPEGYENNWVKTVPGKNWFVMFRLYGPKQAFLDKTWQLNDFERIN